MIDIELNKIERTLSQAIYESETAIDDPDKGYAYACGYSRSALKTALDDVQRLRKAIQSPSGCAS
jgi:hypothetical protein